VPPQSLQMIKKFNCLGCEMKKEKVHKVMSEYKEGTLKSSSGQKVTNSKQAIAIALSEAGMSKKKKKHHSAEDGSFLEERRRRFGV